MSDDALGRAKFTREGDAVVATFSRLLDDTIDRVWTALTAPEEIVNWMAPGTIELRQGGRAQLEFVDSGIVIDSIVSAIEPRSLLEYSWSGPGEPLRPLRWEIKPEGDAVRLMLSLKVPANEDAGRSAAGWDAHLEMLAATLAGVPIKFPFELYKVAREAYRAQLNPNG